MAMLLYLSGIWVRLIFREHCGGQIGDFRIQWKVTVFFVAHLSRQISIVPKPERLENLAGISPF